MRRHPSTLVGATMALLGGVAIGSSPAMATPCSNLQSLQLQHTVINSATDNTTGTFVAPGAPPTTITGLPPFCRVIATLTPSSDSAIKIEVWLPESGWNGRFLGTGGGGFQGVITYSELATGIKAGFAATNSDLGTGSSGCSPLFCGSDGNMGNPLAIAYGDPASPSTGLFGHPERIKDFGYRAIHLMTVRGKEIVNAFYRQRSNKAYFAGCSTGGQNALMEAQRFPDDYDGILAGAAAFNRTHLHMAGLAGWQNTHASPGRLIQPGQMTLINQAVLKQCAGHDGGTATDPFLTDPRDCRFDPKQLLCSGGKLPPACLTADQVTTIQKYYAGTFDAHGQLVNPGSERGNETDDVTALGLAFQEQLPEPAFDGLFYWVFGPSFGYPASRTNFANFDFGRDLDKVDDQLAGVLNATSTDLGEFRERGGKLLMYHGWADPLIPSQSSINYFNALVGNEGRAVQEAGFFPGGGNSGLQRTQNYARLFMVPGMYHCSGGPGPNTFDALTPLVKWVEGGTAPDTILATKFVADTPPAVQMTRPLCVFPKVAQYDGSGSASAATNFSCVVHDTEFNQKPAPKYGP
ncbi:tannase/feruloyl esterase family alpha/beta hydrolase [Bradyrhizobium genosp. L]|uniref:tannase/feruloyl esterase family alpha/beta hydrolase n=1 Tax=Bradyrhizobium genosp. L TaxID=83637 RepID=UPI0018A2C39F|nr:tannase/feruloyl esterase family alpha/beta hydrolase [Bradyrhizobium genosp. L]QPF84125.1 tannase/feruloyl esterase family alpha/beta hydrolase [Bradyrhizobium genosp. L]